MSRLQGPVNFGGGIVDSPSSTSEITYSFQINSIDGGTLSMGYSGAESNMVVMEVGP